MEAPTEESASGQPQLLQSGQPHNLQKPGAPGALSKAIQRTGPLVHCPWRTRGTLRAQVNATGHLRAPLRAGRLGSLVMPGSFGRAFGW
jgi:hypothetical protein